MILQISFYVVAIIVAFIVINAIVLVSISPKAMSEVKLFTKNMRSSKNIALANGITQLLERISTSKDRSVLYYLLSQLKAETKKAAKEKGELADHARTVAIWLGSFNIERHISDLRSTGESSQIRYDATLKNFKLLIPSQTQEK